MQAANLAPARSGPADAALFDRPALLWAIAAGAVASFLARQGGMADVVAALQLPDNDDAMRLVQVRDWIGGQGWFDTTQHRYLPPTGGAMHWSRLVDLPVAGLILLLKPLAGERLAEGLAVVAWPFLLLGAYLALVLAATRRLVGLRAACLAVFVATQMPSALLFDAGKIDHHNVQIIVTLAAALCLALPGPRPATRGALGGALCALSLAVGLETLPFVATLAACSAVLWIARGGDEAPALAGFAAGLGAGAPLLFALQTDPARWASPVCDALSAPWLLPAGVGGLAALGLAAASGLLPGVAHRGLVASLAGGALVALLALTFPDCLRGPYAELPDLARRLWLQRVNEARPLFDLIRDDPLLPLSTVLPLLVAGAFAAVVAWRDAQLRRPFGILSALLGCGVLVCVFQIRGIYVGSAFLPVVAAAALDRVVVGLTTPSPLRHRLGLAALGCLLIGKTWLPLAALAGIGGQADAAGLTGPLSCDEGGLHRLDRLPPGLVLAPIDLGPNLLLKTGHAIIAAPYHRNVDGITAGAAAFAGDEAEMRAQVERFGADYVVLCRAWLRPGATSPVFAERLAAGIRAGWLDPVEGGAGLGIWRVRHPATR